MRIWRQDDAETFIPEGHFGGLRVANVVPFEGGSYSVQISTAPPGGGGEMHHHETWEQVFYVMKGELTFDTGEERFTLRAGESVVFEPREPHATLNEGEGESVSMVITVERACDS